MIVAVPAATPVISPVDAFTVATPSSEDEKLPPDVALLEKVVVPPTQIELVPLKVPAETFAFTVTSLVEDTGEPQPEDTV